MSKSGLLQVYLAGDLLPEMGGNVVLGTPIKLPRTAPFRLEAALAALIADKGLARQAPVFVSLKKICLWRCLSGPLDNASNSFAA